MLNLEQVVFKMESKDYVPQDAILFARICLVPDLTHGRFIILFAFTILVCTRLHVNEREKHRSLTDFFKWTRVILMRLDLRVLMQGLLQVLK